MEWNLSERKVIIVLLLSVVATALSVVVDRKVEQQRYEAQLEYHRTYIINSVMRRSSDELSRLARTYVATGDTRYRDHFWQVKSIRDGKAPLPQHYDRAYWDFVVVPDGQPPYSHSLPESLQTRALQTGTPAQGQELLAKARELSDQLVEQNEQPAFELVERAQLQSEPMRSASLARAQELVFGQDYHLKKRTIMRLVNELFELTEQRAQEREMLVDNRLKWVRSIKYTALILLFSGLCYLLYRLYQHASQQAIAIDRGKSKIRTQKKGLAHAHRQVEQVRADAAQERMAIIGALVNNVSHELRNPLAAIRNSATLLRKTSTLTKAPPAERNLDRIDRALKRCDRLLDELFSFNKQSPLQLAPIDMTLWFSTVVNSELVELRNGHKLHLSLALLGHAEIDPELLLRVFTNLFDNAVQAIESSNQHNKGEIWLSTNIVDNRLTFTIEDNGPGIEEQNTENLFEPLYSTKPNGMGLGLSIVQSIVESHTGEIEIGPSKHGGLRVTVSLPRLESVPFDQANAENTPGA